MKTITEKTTKILNLIIPEGDIDYKVRKILRGDLKRKLAEFQIIDCWRRSKRAEYGGGGSVPT